MIFKLLRENIAIFGQKILDVRGTSFQRKRLNITILQRGIITLKELSF